MEKMLLACFLQYGLYIRGEYYIGIPIRFACCMKDMGNHRPVGYVFSFIGDEIQSAAQNIYC
jgi:hypothetical protein